MDYEIKDSGNRQSFSTGSVRDTEDGKPRERCEISARKLWTCTGINNFNDYRGDNDYDLWNEIIS